VLGDGLRLSVGTLTALPVPPPRTIDRRVAAVAMLAAPLAGVVPAVSAGAMARATVALGGSTLLAAAVALGAVALTTRGLHLDGLADTADGLTAAYDRDRALEVMKRGNTGPAGAATLVLVLLVQVAAFAQALDRHGAPAVVGAVVIGRGALMVACGHGVPAARAGGLGATVAGSVPVAAWIGGQLLLAGLGYLTLGPGGAVAVAAALVVVQLVLARTRSRLGGITGDVLGACVEASTTAAAVVLALIP
jgi:adenosylcobinamide-GDP ribazoletransferase